MSLVSGIRSGLLSGLRSGLNPTKGLSYAGTTDVASGIKTPANVTEWDSLLAVAGTSGSPSYLHLCQEASGSLADSIGSHTWTAAGGVQYQQSVAGWTRKAVGFDGTATAYFANTGGPDASTTSVMRLILCHISAAPASEKALFTLSWAGSGIRVAQNASGTLRYYQDTAGGSGASSHTGSLAIVWRLNRTAGTLDILTNVEKIAGVYDGTFSDGGKGIGDTQGAGSHSNFKVLHDTTFVGGAAEKSNADVKSILTTMGFSVPWSP